MNSYQPLTGNLLPKIHQIVEAAQGPICQAASEGEPECTHLAKYKCEVCGVDACKAHGRIYNRQELCNDCWEVQAREDAHPQAGQREDIRIR